MPMSKPVIETDNAITTFQPLARESTKWSYGA